MSKKEKSKSDLSGESIALGLLSAGLLVAYVFPEAFDNATQIIAAALIVVGIGAFIFEIQKRLNGTGMRFENGGLGLMVGIVSFWIMSLAYSNLNGIWKYLAVSLTLFFLTVGIMATIDFFVSVFETLISRARGWKDIFMGMLKFLALLASTLASIAAAWQQLGIG